MNDERALRAAIDTAAEVWRGFVSATNADWATYRRQSGTDRDTEWDNRFTAAVAAVDRAAGADEGYLERVELVWDVQILGYVDYLAQTHHSFAGALDPDGKGVAELQRFRAARFGHLAAALGEGEGEPPDPNYEDPFEYEYDQGPDRQEVDSLALYTDPGNRAAITAAVAARRSWPGQLEHLLLVLDGRSPEHQAVDRAFDHLLATVGADRTQSSDAAAAAGMSLLPPEWRSSGVGEALTAAAAALHTKRCQWPPGDEARELERISLAQARIVDLALGGVPDWHEHPLQRAFLHEQFLQRVGVGGDPVGDVDPLTIPTVPVSDTLVFQTLHRAAFVGARQDEAAQELLRERHLDFDYGVRLLGLPYDTGQDAAHTALRHQFLHVSEPARTRAEGPPAASRPHGRGR
jgi:hypothetical protein